MPDIVNIIKNANTQNRGKFDIKSILSSVGFSLALSIILFVAFSLLRPRNNVVYAPKVKYADEKHQPPRLKDTPWAWIKPILKLREEYLIDRVGLDAVIFLRFLRLCRNYLAITSVIGLGAIVPINVIGTNRTASGTDVEGTLNPLLRLTVSGLVGNWIIPHIAFSYVFTLLLMYFIWSNYRTVVRLRQKYFQSDDYQSALASRTLMLIDLPQKVRSDDALAQRAMALKNAQTFSQAQCGRDVGKLPALIEKHDSAVRKLESILAKYLKDPHKLPAKRPTCKSPNGTADAIDYYTSRIQSLEQQVEAARESYGTLGTKSYGFVSYPAINQAHAIARANSRNKDVFLAPRPNDILWRNMGSPQSKRSSNKFFGNVLFVALCLAWTVPNALIATFLSNIYNLGAVWPWFQGRINANPDLWAVIQGIAAPILLAIFFLILPSIMRRISQFEGALTKSSRERTVFHKLFLFFFINNFVIFTLFGLIWNFVQQTIVVSAQEQSGFSGFWNALRNSYFFAGLADAVTATSTFWIIYIAQRNLGCLLDLVQVWSLLVKWFKRTFMAPTPREMIEWSAPIPFDYASYYNSFLYNFTIVLSYATLAPLILPFGLLYFVISGISYKYTLLYVNVTRVESGGAFWRILINRLLLVAGFSNLVLFVIVWVKTNIYRGIAVLPALVILIAFKIYLVRTLDPHFYYYAQETEAAEAPIDHRNDQKRDRLRSRFGHPALSHKLIVPMVHERSRHLLKEIYRGRLHDSDIADERTPVVEHVDKQFEVVPEGDLDFDHFKERPEFAEGHGGGEIYDEAKPPREADDDGRSVTLSDYPIDRRASDDRVAAHQAIMGGRPGQTQYPSHYARTVSYNGSVLGADPNDDNAYEMEPFGQRRSSGHVTPVLGRPIGPPSRGPVPRYESQEDMTNLLNADTAYRRY